MHGTSSSRGARLCQYEKVRGISALPIDLSTTIARLGGGGVPSERVIENLKKIPDQVKMFQWAVSIALVMRTTPASSASSLSSCFSPTPLRPPSAAVDC